MSLRKIVRETSGQDVRECRNCATCSRQVPPDLLDISLEGMMQMILFDDDEILSSRTVWSDEALSATAHACKRGISLPAVIMALRAEAQRRGITMSDGTPRGDYE